MAFVASTAVAQISAATQAAAGANAAVTLSALGLGLGNASFSTLLNAASQQSTTTANASILAAPNAVAPQMAANANAPLTLSAIGLVNDNASFPALRIAAPKQNAAPNDLVTEAVTGGKIKKIAQVGVVTAVALPALMTPQGINPLTAIQGAKTAIAIRTINPAELRALAAQQAETAPLPPGTPTLPIVAPPAASPTQLADGAAAPQLAAATQVKLATALADSAKKDADQKATPEQTVLANASQHATHLPTPVQKTEAQALSLRLDAPAAKLNGLHDGTQSGANGNQGESGKGPDDGSAKAANSAKVEVAAPDGPLPASTANTASTIATTTSSPAAAAAVASTVQAAPAHIAATLQVAVQTHADTLATAQPNLAALAVSIAAKSKDGEKQFDIRMDPAELGRVDVRLSVDAAGKAQAHLTADRPQTLALLQRDSATLERSLKDAGLDLSNNGLNFSLKGQDRQEANTQAFAAPSRALSVSALHSVDASANSHSTASFAPGDTRLDIRV